jgi:hypothetical protein
MSRDAEKATKPEVPYDAANPEHVGDAKARAKARADREHRGLAAIMNHPDTRAYLHSLLEDAGPFLDPFTGNSETFYRCGKQAWARRVIAKLLDKHLDQYVLMMKEANGA